jgi:Ala-tRNA(Pro) deacylase
VALLACLVDVLQRERVPYVTLRHPPAYTAPELSAVAHIPGRRSAKVVICIADGRPVQAVVPAHYSVDLEALRMLAHAVSLRLAHEKELAALYPEFEVGAMPPFGMMHGHPVFVERCFVGEPEMVFNAGTHTDSLCMHYADFAEVARPMVGAFGVPPVRPPRPLRQPRPVAKARHRIPEA